MVSRRRESIAYHHTKPLPFYKTFLVSLLAWLGCTFTGCIPTWLDLSSSSYKLSLSFTLWYFDSTNFPLFHPNHSFFSKPNNIFCMCILQWSCCWPADDDNDAMPILFYKSRRSIILQTRHTVILLPSASTFSLYLSSEPIRCDAIDDDEETHVVSIDQMRAQDLSF